MDWTDLGIVLSSRTHGESGLLVILLSQEHGRHAGMARGQRLRRELQPGTLVRASWRARLSEHLGSFALEPEHSVVGRLIDDPLRLSALSSACALAETALPERFVVPGVFEGMAALLEALDGDFWDAVYVRWEVGLLAALGFGLDLERCAATGATEDLTYISPRTGRAVSAAAAEPYRDRLLPLPRFLLGGVVPEPSDILEGLRLTGHFLARNVYGQAHRPLPAARLRYLEDYSSHASRSGRLPPS